jgi:hypothetical protein
MRAAVVSFVLVALGGCNNPDPDWAKPCPQQRTPSMQVGSGASQYVPIAPAGVPIEVDTTGTYVWLGVSCQGLGPDVTVSCGVKDAANGDDLATLTSQAIQLAYDHTTDRDEAAGLVADVVDPGAAQQLVGRKVTVWADASGCGRSVHGETSTVISGFDTSTCQGCLDQTCGSQVAACDSECTAIQACLDAYCVNLSANASPDEVTCQAYCQSLHPMGKAAHVALVSCVQTSMCQPPCNGYSIDYDACVAAQNTGVCANLLAACSASPDCQNYKACVSGCGSWADCQRCAANHPAGEKLFESYDWCIESTCLTLGWVPHI